MSFFFYNLFPKFIIVIVLLLFVYNIGETLHDTILRFKNKKQTPIKKHEIWWKTKFRCLLALIFILILVQVVYEINKIPKKQINYVLSTVIAAFPFTLSQYININSVKKLYNLKVDLMMHIGEVIAIFLGPLCYFIFLQTEAALRESKNKAALLEAKNKHQAESKNKAALLETKKYDDKALQDEITHYTKTTIFDEFRLFKVNTVQYIKYNVFKTLFSGGGCIKIHVTNEDNMLAGYDKNNELKMFHPLETIVISKQDKYYIEWEAYDKILKGQYTFQAIFPIGLKLPEKFIDSLINNGAQFSSKYLEYDIE